MPMTEEPLARRARSWVEETPPMPNDFVRPEIPKKWASKPIGEYLAHRRENETVCRIADHLDAITPQGEVLAVAKVQAIVDATGICNRAVQAALKRLNEVEYIKLIWPAYPNQPWKYYYLGWRLGPTTVDPERFELSSPSPNVDPRAASVSSLDGRRKHR